MQYLSFSSELQVELSEQKMKADIQQSKEFPFLLFPIRLETRFIDNEFWVRIYPDQINVDTRKLELTQAERKAGDDYRNQIKAA